jgi:hypothetical protein
MEKFRFYALWMCLIMTGIYLLQVLVEGFTDALVLNKESFFQPYRFLSSVFLHGSLTHLLYNLFALGLFGSILEKLAGGKRFLFVFFLSGLLASLVSVNFYERSLGASGAIYGILGALTIIRPKMMVWASGFPLPMFLAAVVWTLGSVMGIFIPSNIGHIAHLSGIIAGFVFGAAIRNEMPKQKKKQKIVIPESYMREWERIYMR